MYELKNLQKMICEIYKFIKGRIVRLVEFDDKLLEQATEKHLAL